MPADLDVPHPDSPKRGEPEMQIAIIGAGRVGSALGRRWSGLGHHVVYGVRDPDADRFRDLGRTAAPARAVEGVDVVLIALPWNAVGQVLPTLDVQQAVVLDATNPRGAVGHDRSGGEHVAELLGSSRVVKAFNTTGSANMENPTYPQGTPMMALAGDDADAKATAARLARELGFDPVDAGGLTAARDLEHLAELWIRLAYELGAGPDIAFALLRRPGRRGPGGGARS